MVKMARFQVYLFGVIVLLCLALLPLPDTAQVDLCGGEYSRVLAKVIDDSKSFEIFFRGILTKLDKGVVIYPYWLAVKVENVGKQVMMVYPPVPKSKLHFSFQKNGADIREFYFSAVIPAVEKEVLEPGEGIVVDKINLFLEGYREIPSSPLTFSYSYFPDEDPSHCIKGEVEGIQLPVDELLPCGSTMWPEVIRYKTIRSFGETDFGSATQLIIR
ncbi:MAG: hypothetical protein Q8N68_01590 [bacterium]|nr:hypothetical protein [bacterium]